MLVYLCVFISKAYCYRNQRCQYFKIYLTLYRLRIIILFCLNDFDSMDYPFRFVPSGARG